MSCGNDHNRRLAALVATLASERSPQKQYFPSAAAAARAEEKFVVSIPAADGPPQKVTVVLPSALAGTAPSTDLRPLVVSLHTWGGDHTQKDNEDLAEHAPKLGWIYIFPDFQGPNKKPEVRNVSNACVSFQALPIRACVTSTTPSHNKRPDLAHRHVAPSWCNRMYWKR